MNIEQKIWKIQHYQIKTTVIKGKCFFKWRKNDDMGN